MWDKLLKRDHFLTGLFIGLMLPAIFFMILSLVDMGIVYLFKTHMLDKPEYLYIVSIAINLFAIKYYFVNLQFDKTGRGVLLITFVLTILYFVFF